MSSLNIIIVEDDTDLRTLITEGLATMGSVSAPIKTVHGVGYTFSDTLTIA